MGAMSDWRSFWDSPHSIYVNARYKDVHYREIAAQIAAFVPGPDAPELDRVLALWHRLLAPGGTLIVADVIPPDAGALSDVTALLRYAAANGFFLAALWGLAR